MKKITPLILFLFISISSLAQKANVIKFNAASLFEKSFSIGFERQLNETRSFQLAVDFHAEKDKDDFAGDKYRGIGLLAEYRFYGLIPAISTSDDIVLNGFFVGPATALRRVTYKDNDRSDPLDEHVSLFQAGAVAGYQWLPKKYSRLSLEGSVALMASFSFGEDVEGFGEDLGIGARFNSGIIPVLSLSVGYVFGK